MSESAVILEGEVARRFNPVDKLRATNQDSSVSDWVPSDTLDLGSLMASENTLYLANLDDDCDAYEEVEVDVSTDLEDADDLTKATTKITGKDPNLDPNNDYAAGVDENGNLTKEMIPAAIHIVVKPRKLKYEDGETLDFTGIHVYLMDGNNKRYTDSSYPTGEIPFGELTFPVTVAVANEDTGDNSKYATSELDTSPLEQPIPFGSTLRQDGEYRAGGSVAVYSKTVSGADAVIAYGSNDYVYLFAASEPFTLTEHIVSKWKDTGDIIADRTSESHSTMHWEYKGKTVHYLAGTSLFSNLREVSLSPTVPMNFLNSGKLKEIAWTLIYGDITEFSRDVNIPVQYIRSDGEILEDTFEIEIVSEQEPVPEPQPDPWAGYADVSWNGHHYNLNRRIVPEVHYANGYCWQEGTSEYTVEQSASMGWLILIR